MQMSSIGGNTQDRDDVEGSDHENAESDYESSLEGQRAGRFYGPDSSWRYYTQDERALAASLQQSENNDLSQALYNVHAMKARARGPESISAAKPWHSKGRWIQPDSQGNMPFQPPSKWTAWPLKPGTVPRTREVFGVPAVHPDEEADTYSKPESWKPSLTLEEVLKAGFLRKAKDRFNNRQWENDTPHASQSRSASRETSEDPESNSGREKAESMKDDAAAGSEALFTPNVLADDDLASIILQPTVRHIISRQDDLLSALHQSRRGHRMHHSFTTRAKRNASSRPASTSRTDRSAKPARKRKRAVSDAVQSDANVSEDLNAVETSTKAPRKPRGEYRRLPGTRDWSEVLGIAAMAGWEQSVIDRAARRCAALFGESMSMRFMAEASTDHLQDKVVEYIPDMIPSFETPLETPTEDLVEEDSNACPHVSCRRHLEPYEKRWRLSEHLKKAHKYSTKELEDWKLQAINRGRRNAPIAVSSSGDEGDDDEDNDFEVVVNSVESVREDFLQPITVHIGRSRDKRPRASASRSRSRKAPMKYTADKDVVGGASAMSTDSEL